MKTPKQVREDIRFLTNHLVQWREEIIKQSDCSIAQIGKECRRTADALGELLKSQELPNDYKVAVVGRFKTRVGLDQRNETSLQEQKTHRHKQN